MLCLTFAMNAQDQPVSTQSIDPNAPVLKLLQDTIDYGTIDQNSNRVRMAKVKNVGKSDLVISNCQGSCGCTVPKCPTQAIKPGETAEIEVNYDTGRIGTFTKTVTITSNAKNGTVMLQIKGNVKPAPAPAAPAAEPAKTPGTTGHEGHQH